MKDIPAATTDTQDKRTQNEDDLTGDDLKHYEAYIEAMKFILISIPNDIYNSVDFDKFTAEIEESLSFVYNHFSQLINDMNRKKVIPHNVTIDTKFLNCLQREWYKYVTNVCLAKNLKKDIYDMLYDHLQQYESFINASRANTYASSLSFRSPSAYYVTHPPFVVDYDDDYKGDAVCDDQEDIITTTIMLLARAITQHNSTPTNNRLCTSSNIRNQAVVPADKVNIQSRNVGNVGRFARRSSNIQEEFVESNNVQKETGNENVQRTLQTSLVGNASTKDEAGVILSNEQNDFLLVDAPEMEELEEFSLNTCVMARIQKEELVSGIRGFILSRETLPNVRNAYATISSEESHRVAVGSIAEMLMYFMARATSTKSWLWHQRLSHINFDTINDLARNYLVTGLPKFKYHKEHLCPSCEQGKSKRASHPLKPFPNSKQRLHLLHMDLCGPMKIASINGKRYILISPFFMYSGLSVILRMIVKILGNLVQKVTLAFSLVILLIPVYNRRTKKIMETMNVKFDELSAMAFKQSSLKLGLQSLTSGHISSGLDLPYDLSTITTQRPTEGELVLLFEAMYDDHIGGQPLAAPRTILAGQAPQVLQTPTATITNSLTPPRPRHQQIHPL
ncbi:retrovirus-related pol polyprotein from transposon TNT 1-94 [Tanacetum coccineum]|uniref:Retrovirus-related pol polyprotein from transposon TNT 1-94 n=1 Tax=Tanacetum coccineum TaxID=301880 RepID=A0ABQ5GZ59_9ASTR